MLEHGLAYALTEGDNLLSGLFLTAILDRAEITSENEDEFGLRIPVDELPDIIMGCARFIQANREELYELSDNPYQTIIFMLSKIDYGLFLKMEQFFKADDKETQLILKDDRTVYLMLSVFEVVDSHSAFSMLENILNIGNFNDFGIVDGGGLIMANIKYEIKKHIGIISEKNSWTRELNIISWNGGKPKYDIRDWDADHEKMSKGITLSEEEMKALKKLLDTQE